MAFLGARQPPGSRAGAVRAGCGDRLWPFVESPEIESTVEPASGSREPVISTLAVYLHVVTTGPAGVEMAHQRVDLREMPPVAGFSQGHKGRLMDATCLRDGVGADLVLAVAHCESVAQRRMNSGVDKPGTKPAPSHWQGSARKKGHQPRSGDCFLEKV